MFKKLSMILCLNIIFLMVLYSPIYAKSMTTISDKTIDLSNDGYKEHIKVLASPFAKNSTYYSHFKITIKTHTGKKLSIHQQGGYKPNLSIIDINHDGLKDLLFTHSPIKDKFQGQTSAFTLKNNKISELSLPQQTYVHGKFTSHFTAKIKLYPEKPAIDINLEQNANNYILQEIYNDKGELLKYTPLHVNKQSSYTPFKIGPDKKVGLRERQYVYGIFQNRPIGYSTTYWYFDNQKWTNLKTTWTDMTT